MVLPDRVPSALSQLRTAKLLRLNKLFRGSLLDVVEDMLSQSQSLRWVQGAKSRGGRVTGGWALSARGTQSRRRRSARAEDALERRAAKSVGVGPPREWSGGRKGRRRRAPDPAAALRLPRPSSPPPPPPPPPHPVPSSSSTSPSPVALKIHPQDVQVSLRHVVHAAPYGLVSWGGGGMVATADHQPNTQYMALHMRRHVRGE